MPSWQELLLGPVLLKKRPALFREHVENNLASMGKVLAGLKRGNNPDRVRIEALEREMGELEALIE